MDDERARLRRLSISVSVRTTCNSSIEKGGKTIRRRRIQGGEASYTPIWWSWSTALQSGRAGRQRNVVRASRHSEGGTAGGGRERAGSMRATYSVRCASRYWYSIYYEYTNGGEDWESRKRRRACRRSASHSVPPSIPIALEQSSLALARAGMDGVDWGHQAHPAGSCNLKQQQWVGGFESHP